MERRLTFAARRYIDCDRADQLPATNPDVPAQNTIPRRKAQAWCRGLRNLAEDARAQGRITMTDEHAFGAAISP